jgi:HlyD family secretion protein
VTIGQRNGREVQVLDGLAPGDRVVVYPPDTLQDGIKITSRRTSDSTGRQP